MSQNTRKQKPLIIHTERSMGWGGQEIRIFNELAKMPDLGFETALLAPEKSQIFIRAKKAGVTVFPVPFSHKLHLPTWRILFRLFSRLGPKVVNTHSSEDSWMAGSAARLSKVPLVIRTRHVSTPVGSTFSYRFFPHMILTTSLAIKNDLASRGLAKDRITALPTGIDPDRFCFSMEKRGRIRAQWKIGDAEALIGNICVLRSWKGLDFFLDTAKKAPDRFKFMIVGTGPQEEHLKARAKDLGLAGRIIFTGHKENVVDYFSALDLLFFTSYASEGISQAVLQGLSCRLPVVYCRMPSVSETLQGLSACIPVEHGDTATAAAALERAVEKWGTPEARPRDHRQRVIQRHGIFAMLEQTARIYQSHGIAP